MVAILALRLLGYSIHLVYIIKLFLILACVITETKFCEKKLTNEMHIIPKEKKKGKEKSKQLLL